MEKVLQKRPYFLQELFRKRTKATIEDINSISDLETIVYASINKDRESKKRFPKPQSGLKNLLTKTVESSKKHDSELMIGYLNKSKKL